MHDLPPRQFAIRPVHYEELFDLDAPGRWELYRRVMPIQRNVVVAVDGQDAIAGYCAFNVKRQSREFHVDAIESHQPGAGRALLDALKERASRVVAEDVLATAKDWWERRGFTLFSPATEEDEEGVVGHYEWWREDDPQFESAPFASLWPNQTVARLIWDTEDQRRLEQAIQRVVRPGTVPMVSVPASFVEAITLSISAGYVAPEAAAILQPQLEAIAQMQSDPLQRALTWYISSFAQLAELGASSELLDEWQRLMRAYVRHMEL
jgi:hypothetical protein